MRYSTTLGVLGGFAVLNSFTVAHPLSDATANSLFKRVDTPDATCGGTNGYSCTGAAAGGTCCSEHGYCGSTADYCGTGCQAAYGTCTTGNSTGDPNLCGVTNGGTSCGATSDGSCCSQFGYCGNTIDHCSLSNGCQAAFGTCNGTAGGGDGNDLCGPANGNKVCPTGQCCSPNGFCGTTIEFCASPDCLRSFGTCDSDKTPAGASTAGIHRTLLGKVPYGQDIYDCNDAGHIALTYDDGPFTYTNDLLDKLAAYGFKATFFITGNNNGKGSIDTTPAWTSVIQRMKAEGHQIASHTWSHADLSTLTDADRETEMIKNEMALRNILGDIPTYMRPPFSSCTTACKATMKKLGYHITYFDLDTQDYLHTTPETNQISKDVVHSIISGANPANSDFLSIAHDIHEQTVHNLTTYMFDQMVTYGFKGVAAGTCLGDPVANWYRAADSSNSTVNSTSSSTSSTPTSSTESSSSKSASSTGVSKSSTTSSSKPSLSATQSSPTTTGGSTPTSTCAYPQVGKWCPKPFAFNSGITCTTSWGKCLALRLDCQIQSGLSVVDALISCGAWVDNVCGKLKDFCDGCGLLQSCDSTKFQI